MQPWQPECDKARTAAIEPLLKRSMQIWENILGKPSGQAGSDGPVSRVYAQTATAKKRVRIGSHISPVHKL